VYLPPAEVGIVSHGKILIDRLAGCFCRQALFALDPLGTKSERPNIRVMGKRHFKVLSGKDDLVQALFNLPENAAQTR